MESQNIPYLHPYFVYLRIELLDGTWNENVMRWRVACYIAIVFRVNKGNA